MLKTGRGSPAGLLIYNDTRIPEQYRGLLYYPDVFRKLVRAYKVAPDGSDLQDHQRVRVHQERRSALPPLPDGDRAGRRDLRLRLADRLRRRRQALRRRHSTAASTASPGPARRTARHCPAAAWIAGRRFKRLPDDELVETLCAPGPDRPRRGPQGTGPPRSEGPRPRASEVRLRRARRRRPARRASACCPRTGTPDVEDLFRLLLNDESPDVRRLAVDGLGLQREAEGRPRLRGARPKCSATANPAVRRVAALAIGRLGGDGAGEIARERLPARRAGRRLPQGRLRPRASSDSASPASTRSCRWPPPATRSATSRSTRSSRLRTRPAADALPELLTQPAPDGRPARSRWCGRTRTTSSTRRSRSTRWWSTWRSGRTNRSRSFAAALEVFAVSGDANAAKAANIVFGLLEKPDDDMRYAAIQAVEDLRIPAQLPNSSRSFAIRPSANRSAPRP